MSRSQASPSSGLSILGTIERLGNRLPDPVTLFVAGAMVVLVGSEWAARAGWCAVNPATGEEVAAQSLLSSEGFRWVWQNLISNFTGFPPLGIVLVGMIGIGVAERSGLLGTLLKAMVVVTPASLITPSVIFVGVMSSMASDAGYIVLPPLAAAIFAQYRRSPLVGLATVFAGVGAGFSANLLITGLDPLLQSFTQTSARILVPDYVVDERCNYYFMIVSTGMITVVGWGVTRWIVEPRFSSNDVREQIQVAGLAAASDQAESETKLSPLEKRSLLAGLLGFLISGGLVTSLILVPGAALHGTADGRAVWLTVIVPILFFVFLVPGVTYGMASGSIRSDRDIAKMMNETMRTMGPYVVMAFFAAQFVSWFNHSNLGVLVALEGVEFLRTLELPVWSLVLAIIGLSALLNLFVGSASAKWALISTVFVPVFMGVGISPELTQAAYRVGDSVTNPIAPLNPYIVVMLLFMKRVIPHGGIGSLVSLMLPYSLAFVCCWSILLIIWMALGLPLGPGDSPLFLELPEHVSR